MEEKDLKPCWKCGNNGVFVFGKGEKKGNAAFKETGFVACESFVCMDREEIYSEKEWQEHEREVIKRPATREQLVEALRKARKYVETSFDSGIVNAGFVLSEIDLLLEGEQ